MGRDRVVGFTTSYRLVGQDVECRWGTFFLYPPDRPWNPTSVLYNGNPDIPGVKRQRRGVDHPFHVDTYVYYVYNVIYILYT